MKRSLILTLICAVVLLPFIVSIDANAQYSGFRYEYHSYYYDSYGNYEGYSVYITGASDGDALYLEAHYTYYKTDSAGNSISLYVGFYFYYKSDGSWIYYYHWWLEWEIIYQWLYGDYYV